MESRLTVFFEDPFWVGVWERQEDEMLSVCKVTFGAEPTDAQLYAFLLSHYGKLTFSRPIKAEQTRKADNPKRRQRAAHRCMDITGVGTKSQQALQRQREEQKDARRAVSRERKEAEKERQFAIKQEKKKEKHKGH
ncbi:MAG: YjdF family protein [Clostridia bacterium]|nr:YjdF family protein [Clostridia bacterium]